MKIIGIDPGTNCTGYGVVNATNQSFRLIEYGVLKPPRTSSFQEKMLKICQQLSELIHRLQPEIAVIEDVFFSVNQRSALKLGHIRGAIIVTLASTGLQVRELTPREIKSGITGYGQADKDQVAEMVRILLKLEKRPHPLDASDALATAMAYALKNDFEEKINSVAEKTE